jgi:hypothetical protein
VSDLAVRAAAIRDYLRDREPNLVRRYSFVAARWEQLRLKQHHRQTTPGEDARLRELTASLKVLTHGLNLPVVDPDSDGIEAVTWHEGFLPLDPQRILSRMDWIEAAEGWN